jgi:hypothetical protein
MDMMNAQCFKSTAKLRQTLRIFGVKIDCAVICVDFSRNASVLNASMPELKRGRLPYLFPWQNAASHFPRHRQWQPTNNTAPDHVPQTNCDHCRRIE